MVSLSNYSNLSYVLRVTLREGFGLGFDLKNGSLLRLNDWKKLLNEKELPI